MSQPPPDFLVGPPVPHYGGFGGYPQLSHVAVPQAYPGPPPFSPPVPQPPQRPAAVTVAATLAVTASLQFVAVLTFVWLVAVAGGRALGTTGDDGVLYHAMHRFDDRMLDGLAWPLYLFPLATLVLGLLLPVRRPWVRLAFSGLGVTAAAWLAWWCRTDLSWWIVPGTYIALTVGLLWLSEVSSWYAWPSVSDQRPQPR